MSPGSGVLGPIREMLSPYKIAVLIFIEKYNRIDLKYGDGLAFVEEDMDFTLAERKSTALLLFKLVQGGDKKFGDLNQLVDSSALSKSHVAAWRESLKKVVNVGVDAFMDLFDVVSKAVQKEAHDTWPCIWTSIVGLYVRQMNLLYKRLAFTEVVALHTHLVQYCRSSSQPPQPIGVDDEKYAATEGAENSTLPSAMDITMASPPNTPSLLTSPDFLVPDSSSANHQHLQSPEDPPLIPGSSSDQLAKLGPSGIFETGSCTWSVQQAEQLIGEQTQLLEFNECEAMTPVLLHTTLQQILAAHPHLSSAHYLSSLNFLRVNEARGAVESLVAAYDCQQVTRSTPRTLRYAALNMGALYSHFGSTTVALRCVSEAIAQSQEAGDSTCLQHALAWLYALAPHKKRESLIQTAVERSGSLELPYLSWLGLINQAAHPSGRHPSHHLKMLVSRVDGCVGVSGGGLGGGGGVWGVEAGVWGGWLGSSCTMAAVCSQLVLHAPPTLKQLPAVPFATSQTAAVFCNIANTLADAGEYKLCHSLLNYASGLFPDSSPHAHYIRLTTAHVTCTQHLFMGRYTAARKVLLPLLHRDHVYVKIRMCEISVYQGEKESALQQVSELLVLEEVKEKPQLLVQVQMLFAAALSTANGHSNALISLVTTADIALKNHLALLHSLVTLQLTGEQLALGLLLHDGNYCPGYAAVDNPNIHAYNYYNISHIVDKEAVDRALSVIMASGSLYDQARSLLLVATLRIRASKGNAEKLCRATRDLEQVKQMFTKLGAQHRLRDTLYFCARAYHQAGNLEARNKSSLEFRLLEESMPNNNNGIPPRPAF